MSPSRFILALFATLLTALAPALAGRDLSPAAHQEMVSERRVALVIGNGRYPVGPLGNPGNDAVAMAAVLKDLGFEVSSHKDLSFQDMRQVIQDFGGSLSAGGVGLFYYAGHGIQVNGKNYMIPVDARLEGEGDVEIWGVDVGAVLAKMDQAGNRLNLVVLDACRNNPFERSWRSGSRGLAFSSAPAGTLLAYATAPGSVAADGSGRNGAYTEALIRRMRAPNTTVEDMFKQVRLDVQGATGGQQVPWESSSLTGDFYFRLEQAAAAATTTSTDDALARPFPLASASAKQREKVMSDWEGCREGNAFNCAYLGYLYENGTGVAPDNERAAALYRMGCDGGNKSSCYNLGVCYDEGTGVEQDEAKAASLYRQVCDGGHTKGCYNLGVFYDNGDGVAEDQAKAASYYKKACDGGHAKGCSNLGTSYFNGEGVAKSYDKAASLYKKACDAKHGRGCYNLGGLYWRGDGRAVDRDTARRYFSQACALDYQTGCEWKDKH